MEALCTLPGGSCGSCRQPSAPHGVTSVIQDLKLEKCPVAAGNPMLDSTAHAQHPVEPSLFQGTHEGLEWVSQVPWVGL